MSQAEYAAVDWGTSSFRLWLIDRAGGVLQERRSQEGSSDEALADRDPARS
ncbi:MAG: 2-dehydro-3-deoxygalactonokinase, partial [Pseudolabrys sp.]